MNVQVIGRAVDCGGKTLGVAGDHHTETVYFHFDREPVGEVSIKVKVGTTYLAELPLTLEGNIASWTVEQASLAAAGDMTCQLRAVDDTYSPAWVWQSEQFTLTVLASLEVTSA